MLHLISSCLLYRLTRPAPCAAGISPPHPPPTCHGTPRCAARPACHTARSNQRHYEHSKVAAVHPSESVQPAVPGLLGSRLNQQDQHMWHPVRTHISSRQHTDGGCSRRRSRTRHERTAHGRGEGTHASNQQTMPTTQTHLKFLRVARSC